MTSSQPSIRAVARSVAGPFVGALKGPSARRSPRRTALMLAATVCALNFSGAQAQTHSAGSAEATVAQYPNRALRLIVPFPPGGAADVVGRTIAHQLSTRLGQPVVVENRPGGGTIVAAVAAASAEPDGYTLSLATTGQLAINPGLHANLPYQPLRSFAPVALVAETPYVISVGAESPIKSVADLIRDAKAQPGRLSFSSCGNGTVCHLTGELLATEAGVDLTHVPFSGSQPAITAVIGGHVTIAADTLAVQTPQVKAGRLRALVVSSEQRSAALPDVPTAAEAGIPGLLSNSWFGIVVPAATPPAIIARLNREVVAATQSDETRRQFDSVGLITLGGTPEQFGAQIRADLDKWGRVIRVASVKID